MQAGPGTTHPPPAVDRALNQVSRRNAATNKPDTLQISRTVSVPSSALCACVCVCVLCTVEQQHHIIEEGLHGSVGQLSYWGHTLPRSPLRRARCRRPLQLSPRLGQSLCALYYLRGQRPSKVLDAVRLYYLFTREIHMQPGSGRHIRAGTRVGSLCVCGPHFLLNQNLSALTELCVFSAYPPMLL